jgi:hypothetical protein
VGWKKIGGSAHSLAIFGNYLVELTPDQSAVYQRDRTSGAWTKIGGPAATLVGGAWICTRSRRRQRGTAQPTDEPTFQLVSCLKESYYRTAQ